MPVKRCANWWQNKQPYNYLFSQAVVYGLAAAGKHAFSAF
tara:strand:+ start:1140 stop:1259 length:120 start_codon:yes stop_codon:yes gene_type:complete